MLAQAEAIGLQAAERAADGGPVLDEDETVLAKFEGMQLVIGASTDQGEGSVFITDWRVFWFSAAESSRSYAMDFPAVAMHAIATDERSSRPCLYIQLDAGDDAPGLGGGGGDDSSSEQGEGEEEEQLPELRLIPADASQLEPLFQAFCEGAERNPDYTDEDEEGEGAGFVYNVDEALAGAAAAALGVGDDELADEDDGRFDDAEGDEVAAPAGGQPNGC